jgi:hypothetical protein
VCEVVLWLYGIGGKEQKRSRRGEKTGGPAGVSPSRANQGTNELPLFSHSVRSWCPSHIPHTHTPHTAHNATCHTDTHTYHTPHTDTYTIQSHTHTTQHTHAHAHTIHKTHTYHIPHRHPAHTHHTHTAHT